MCDFCDNIITEKEYRNLDTWDRNNAIVKINSYDYGLWIECDDCYYSGVKMWIKYCPMCGANLTQEALLKKKRANNSYYQKYGFDF